MSTYLEIRKLQEELGSNKIKTRRDAGNNLVGKLALAEVRNRLAEEASPVGGTRGTIQRRKALREMWRSILQSAVVALQKIHSSKTAGKKTTTTKLCSTDIGTFLKLLHQADPSQQYGTELSLYEPPRMSRTVAKQVFNFCYDLLADETVLEVHGAEMELFKVMAFLCNSTEYVACLRPQVEIDYLVQEIESRIMEDTTRRSSNNNNDVLSTVGKLWENLLVTATRKLGMGLPLLMPGCIEIVAKWCKENSDGSSSSRVVKEAQVRQQQLSPLLRGLSALLWSDPEQAIAPLTRHGRYILSLVRKDYAQCDLAEKISARNEYFMAHLRVAQTAGRLQGLMPGDLGDLGRASLSMRQITNILDVLLGRIMKKGTGNKKVEEDHVAWPLSKDMLLQFELLAQLLACAQRMYLSSSKQQQQPAGDRMVQEEEDDDDFTAALISQIEQEPSPDDYMSLERGVSNMEQQSTCCPLVVLARSPFMEGVLRILYQKNAGRTPSSPTTKTNGEKSTSASRLDELIRLSLAATTTTTTVAASIPSDSLAIASALRVITNCAIVFPNGVCWTSNTTDHWQVLPPLPTTTIPALSHHQSSCGNLEDCEQPLSINACSPRDLALVIDVVAGVLESCGGPSGDGEVQRWTLHCLRALATSTAALVLLSRRSGQGNGCCACLEASWRNVWVILLQRPDCGYREWTHSCGVGSKGELVLQLLFEMLRRSCLDCGAADLIESPSTRRSAFAFRNQTDLWTLPVFSTRYAGSGPVSFLLIYAVLSSVGLSQEQGSGNDTFDLAQAQDLARDNSAVKINRRTRLVVFCMKALDERETNVKVRAIASACIGALISGEASMLRGVLLLGSSEENRLLDLPRVIPGGPKQRDLLSELWTTPSFSADLVLSSSAALDDKPALDSPLHANARLLDMLALEESLSRFSDFIPGSQAEHLWTLVFSKCSEIFFSADHDGGAPPASDMMELEGQDTEDSQVMPGLVRLTIASKLVLTVMLSSKSGMLSSVEQTKFFGNIGRLFRSISSNIGAISEDRDSFWQIFGEVHGLVRAMTGAVSRKQVPELPETCMEATTLLFDTCVALLEESGYTKDRKPATPKAAAAAAAEDDFWDKDEATTNRNHGPSVEESDEDEEEGPPRKRQRRSESVLGSRKRMVLERGPPGQDCTFVVASLLLSLRPSPSVCEFVASTLLGVDRIGDELPAAIDVLGGAVAATLICTEEVFLFPYAADKISSVAEGGVHRSLVLLICRIVAGIRSVSSPQCRFHLFGFDICSEVVRLAYQTPGFELSEEEARLVIEQILDAKDKSERRSLAVRPKLRDAKLRCGVTAFIFGGNKFHDYFDKEFPRSLVIPSLFDLNSDVRCRANRGVAAALQHLPEGKVMESVRKRLPDCFSEPGEEKERAMYRRWYRDKNSGYGEELQQLLHQVWEDLFLSVRYGALGCWSGVARATSDHKMTELYLFEFIVLASVRPDLEGLCFLFLDCITKSNGFKSVDSQLSEYSAGILSRWIQSGKKLMDLPLILTAPFLVGNLLRSGRAQGFFSENSATPRQEVRKASVAEFISRNSYQVLPLLMFRSVSAFMESGVTRDFRRRFIEEGSIKEYCCVFTDTFDDDIVRDVVQSNIGDIVAISSWQKSTSGDKQGVALEVERLMTGLLGKDVVRRHGETTGHRAVRRLLSLASRSTEKSVGNLFVDAARMLAQVLAADPVDDGIDSISSLVGSAAELHVFARYLLMGRVGLGRPGQVWLPMEIVSAVSNEQIRRGSIDIPQVQFSFQLLSNVLVDPKLTSVHFKAVGALKDLLGTTLSAKEAPVLSEMLIEALHIVSDVLGQNLELFLNECKSAKNALDESLRLVLGLRGGYHLESDMHGDTWGWNIVPVEATNTLLDHVKKVPQEISATLGACYDLLQLVFDSHEAARIGHSDIRGVYQASKLSSRRDSSYKDLHPAFGYHYLFENFMDTEAEDGRVPRLQILSRDHDELRRFSLAAQNRPDLSTSQGSSLTIEQKHLIDELGQLRTYLSMLRRHESDADDSGLDLRAGLLDKLGELCGTSFPRDVRAAASRCLGEVELSRVNMDAIGKNGCQSEIWLAEAVESGSLLRTLQARSLEALVSSLQPSDPQIGLVAVETIRALLSTQIGIECQQRITDKRTLSLLEPFASQSNKALNSQLLLSDEEIERVRSKIHGSEGAGDVEWCWDKKLWQLTTDKDMPFEQWVCCVVPALLTCCYGRNTDSSLSPPGSKATKCFFERCQRMSSLEPGFAARLFPSIILDLLLNEEAGHEQQKLDPVLVDTWVGAPGSEVNRKISRCFSILLKGCTGTSEQHAVNQSAIELALDTLSILYQLTQHRFFSSRSHRKNISTLKKTNNSDARSSQESNSSSYRSGSSRDKRSWEGLRFGTVLRLDGLLVARACLRVGRPSSALFYAELYGDNHFGGVTAALDAITLNTSGSVDDGIAPTRNGDISGFGLWSTDAGTVETVSAATSDLENGCEVLTVIRDCYSDLGEKDATEAAETSIAELSVFSGGGISLFAHTYQAASLPYLCVLDNAALGGGDRNRSLSAIGDTLENMGLGFTLESYIAGLTSQYNDVLTDLPRGELVDKFFQCRLLRIPWEDPAFECDGSTAVWSADERHHDLPEDFHSREAGFHALLLEAIKALRGDDYPTSVGHLNKARDSLTNANFFQKTHGFLGDNLQTLMDRSKALNHLESIVRTSGSLPDLLSLAELERKHVAIDDPALGYQALADCTKEITLRHVCAKAKRSGESEAEACDLLVDHMWQSYYSGCKFNQHKRAGGVLSRLHSILQRSADRSNVAGLVVESALLKLQLEEAHLLERTNNFTGAIRSTKQTIRLLQSRRPSLSLEDTGLLAEALVKCGEWMTKHKVEPAHSILDSYLKPGADIAVHVMVKQSSSGMVKQSSSGNAQRASSALLAVSQLASSIFDTVSARVRSLEWQRAGKSLKERQEELRKVSMLQQEGTRSKASKLTEEEKKKAKDLEIYRRRLSKGIDQTVQERNKILQSVSAHQKLILESTGKALEIARVGSGPSLSNYVYRMVDIWFAVLEDKNYSHDFDVLVSEAIETIPSFRFVPLSSQLFSRLDSRSTSTEGSFQARLHELLRKLCRDHPYHCVIQLVAISNGTKVGGGVNGISPTTFLENTAKSGRVKAAIEIMQELRKDDEKWVADLVDSYESLANAYIYLANKPTEELPGGNNAKRINFSSVSKKYADRLDTCLGKRTVSVACPPCVLTKPPPIRPGCDYGDGIKDPVGAQRVKSFDSYFSLTDSGVHRPKIVVCRGSRGGKFIQLVKGEDEIRQDAVMQQVFAYVNELTAKKNRRNSTTATDRQRLNVVTYNIIPLSPSSGVLEWVEEAMPFGEFMQDRSSKKYAQPIGGHSRYYPGEWGAPACRERIKDAGPNEKRAAFDEICEHYSPCFRFFFLERFGHSTDSWYDAKLRYTRSVAVNSIVGHVLGIGDRHCSNILVHQQTGVVVHIDFGIVFEQGKILTIPELVPFRLTRNVVDGMGPMGTEGVFMKAAQSSLAALKDNSNALLTILSSIANDPLYSWCLSPVKVQNKQLDDEAVATGGGNSSKQGRKRAETNGTERASATSGSIGNSGMDRNQAASHAIARVREKLQGYEHGTSGEQQSIEGQVQLLVNSARDHDNLCEMFYGWAPWI